MTPTPHTPWLPFATVIPTGKQTNAGEIGPHWHFCTQPRLTKTNYTLLNRIIKNLLPNLNYYFHFLTSITPSSRLDQIFVASVETTRAYPRLSPLALRLSLTFVNTSHHPRFAPALSLSNITLVGAIPFHSEDLFRCGYFGCFCPQLHRQLPVFPCLLAPWPHPDRRDPRSWIRHLLLIYRCQYSALPIYRYQRLISCNRRRRNPNLISLAQFPASASQLFLPLKIPRLLPDSIDSAVADTASYVLSVT